jgi:hypothetical protein
MSNASATDAENLHALCHAKGQDELKQIKNRTTNKIPSDSPARKNGTL